MSLRHILLRIDGELNILSRIRIPDEVLVKRVMYNAVSKILTCGGELRSIPATASALTPISLAPLLADT